MSPLNTYFDHTLLKPQATEADILNICNEAMEYNFFSVCINPSHVSVVRKALTGSSVKVCTVIGFPLGSNTTATKVFEAQEALQNGADELDMVINIGQLKSENYDYVEQDIKSVVDLGAPVKIILETCLLTDEEIVTACEISKKAKAAFVKTSTGFSSAGATRQHIKLMRASVGSELGVKASGGIRDKATALQMIEAGANRIGASSGVQIMKDQISIGEY